MFCAGNGLDRAHRFPSGEGALHGKSDVYFLQREADPCACSDSEQKEGGRGVRTAVYGRGIFLCGSGSDAGRVCGRRRSGLHPACGCADSLKGNGGTPGRNHPDRSEGHRASPCTCRTKKGSRHGLPFFHGSVWKLPGRKKGDRGNERLCRSACG